MNESNRLQITIDAMKLFIQSLPANCKFGIISFGTNYEWLKDETGMQTLMKYDDETKRHCLSKISEFGANLGGTKVLEPLKEAINFARN